jgi:mannosyl-oligosaccharide alpha-1,3-glucosidase
MGTSWVQTAIRAMHSSHRRPLRSSKQPCASAHAYSEPAHTSVHAVSRRRCVQGLLSLLLLASAQPALAFKAADFKKCSDSSFCVRLRGVQQPTYSVQPDSIQVSHDQLHATLVNTDKKKFALNLSAYEGVLRLHVSEPENARYEVQDVLMESLHRVPLERTGATATHSSLQLGGHEIQLKYNPFQLHIPGVLTLNQRGLLGIEHKRTKANNAPAGHWEETFNGHTDSKPKGPQAISFDITFLNFQNVYGLPERATNLSLPVTSGPGIESDPLRLYNLDVFEYATDSPFGLYGSIPFMTAHRADRTVGAFWLNAAEMYVDISKTAADTSTQWIAESGVLDLFLFLGPEPKDVLRSYAGLTGSTAMPQYFSLGYHQCRCVPIVLFVGWSEKEGKTGGGEEILGHPLDLTLAASCKLLYGPEAL